MFSCEAGDGRGASFGRCLCHTPAFARLNASLSAKFSDSALASAAGVFAAGSGGSTAAKPASRRGRLAFANVRVFDGRSGRAALGPQGRGRRREDPRGRAGRDARRRGSRGRRLRRTRADAGADRRALARDDGAVSARGPVHGGRRLHQSRRGRRSRTNASARLHQRPRHGGPDLRAEARDRRGPCQGTAHLAVRRDDLADRRPRRFPLSLRDPVGPGRAAEPRRRDRRRGDRRRSGPRAACAPASS